MDVQFGFLSDLNEMDYDKMFSLTSELIALEVINRLCITLVEVKFQLQQTISVSIVCIHLDIFQV